MASLNEKSDLYLSAREAYESAKVVANELYNEYKRREYDLVNSMIEDCTASFKRSDGVHLSLREQLNLSVTQENDGAIREWLLESEGDDMSYVEERVSKKALTELIRKKVDEEHVPASEFPSFLKVSTRPGLSVRGISKRMIQ